MSGLHDIENGVISADTIRFRGGLREPPRSRIADSTTLCVSRPGLYRPPLTCSWEWLTFPLEGLFALRQPL